jgi:hypothetical protein
MSVSATHRFFQFCVWIPSLGVVEEGWLQGNQHTVVAHAEDSVQLTADLPLLVLIQLIATVKV